MHLSTWKNWTFPINTLFSLKMVCLARIYLHSKCPYNRAFTLIMCVQISAKEDKYKKEVILLAVKRTHPDYTSFRPEKRQKEIVDNSNDQTADEGQQHKMQLELVEIYKPSVHVNPIFLSVGASTVDFYSALEATDIVFKYVEKENLVKPANKAIVVLDATLCDALFKGAIKKGSSYPTEVHKKDLSTAFLSRMQAHHRVTRGTETIVRKGALKTVQIMTERRQGNKKMTRVSGLESFLIDAEALASELQKKLACSTTVAELPGRHYVRIYVFQWKRIWLQNYYRSIIGKFIKIY